jgi:hypothetical protein
LEHLDKDLMGVMEPPTPHLLMAAVVVVVLEGQVEMEMLVREEVVE